MIALVDGADTRIIEKAIKMFSFDSALRATELLQHEELTPVEEIIGSAKCAVFFIDEDQRVTWKDVGTKADIEQRARRAYRVMRFGDPRTQRQHRALVDEIRSAA